MTPRPNPIAQIVLVAPEIPWNTGNAGRSCLAFGADLHLVGPLGFLLDDKSVRRAGLDYWKYVNPAVWPSWVDFERGVLHSNAAVPWLITPDGAQAPWDVSFEPNPVLVFGSEGQGLPHELRKKYSERRVRVPMHEGAVRSLNVSTTVGILLSEITRQRRSI